MMRAWRTLALLLTATALPAQAGVPRGWFVAGSAPQSYEVGTAPADGARGKLAAYIKAKAGIPNAGFGTLMQCIRADDYRGKRLRLSARLRSVAAASEQLWMRIDGAPPAKDQPPAVLGFYNMMDNPLRGTTGWQQRDVVLDVPAQSITICYGFFLAGGQGEAWADGLNLAPVGKEVALSPSLPAGLPKAPTNLGFGQ